MPVPAASCGAAAGAREPGPCRSPSGRLAAAVSLGAVGSGLLQVLVPLWRYRALRSPINLLLLNTAGSHLLVCALGTPLGLAAARGRGSPGAACAWHGFANAPCGILSLISLAVLSYECCCTMMGTTEDDATNYRKIWIGIVLSWMYSLVWTAPPIFGWSSYGPGTMCSMNWHSKDTSNSSYILCLFIFCLLSPFVIIVYLYGKLLCAVRQVKGWVGPGSNRGMGRTQEQRILIMVVVMVICFLLCWLPYATVTLIATFGKPGLITPAASVIPSILAKSSTVYNPITCIFLKKKFYRCFLALLRCNKTAASSSNKSSSQSCRALPRAQGDTVPAAAESPHPPPEDIPKANRAVLVARYSA
ncbi:LOW QUALITY PROTEIN: pinopsin-like [Rhynochetos jubatus]